MAQVVFSGRGGTAGWIDSRGRRSWVHGMMKRQEVRPAPTGLDLDTGNERPTRPTFKLEGGYELSDLHKPARQKIRRREFRDIRRLTSRQTQVTALLLDGYRYAEIANSLFISENTVRFHVFQIYKILRVRGRRDLLARLSQREIALIRGRSEVAPE
jgi:DNA-binding CsgD family transcriptional regulator